MFRLSLLLVLLMSTQVFAKTKEFTLDLGHAYVGWEVDHMGLSKTVGQFRTYDGKFMIDDKDFSKSKVSFKIDVSSLDSNHVGRDNHLKNKDFLNVEKHKEITFTSTKITMITPTEGKVLGDLTMLGVSKSTEFDFRVVKDTKYPSFIPNYDEIRVIGIEIEGEILRVDHGMDFIAFPGSPGGLLVKADLHLDLVDCAGMPKTNIPCTYGRVKGKKFPHE